MLNLFRDYFNDNLWGVLPFPRSFIHMFSLDPYSSSIGAAPLLSFFFASRRKEEKVQVHAPWIVPVTQKYSMHTYIQIRVLSYNSYNSAVK